MDQRPDSANAAPNRASRPFDGEEEFDLRPLARELWARKRLLAAVFLLSGALGYSASWLMKPDFTSTVTLLPPQQQQSIAATALSSLGALTSLTGGSAAHSPAEEYVSLMQSVTVADRMIDRYTLMEVYQAKYRKDARKQLALASTISVGKKDGIISVSVTDHDPKRAASIANQYVDELRHMTSVLAVSEAQQRRVFFEKLMQDTEARLTSAQLALQASGFNPGAIKAEPQAAAGQYAQLRAQAVTTEVRLQALRETYADTSPQVRELTAQLASLRAQLAQIESASPPSSDSQDYVGKYREFKYQGTLLEILAKQYEAARVDESREGALIQIVDPAQPAEIKSAPRRLFWAIGGSLLGLLAVAVRVALQAKPAARGL